MKNVCKNCKFFRDGSYTDWEMKSGFGFCLHEKIFSDFVHDNEEREEYKEVTDGIYASSDEDRGSLIVGENFGCIHFKNK